jgi:hypothetical protein
MCHTHDFRSLRRIFLDKPAAHLEHHQSVSNRCGKVVWITILGMFFNEMLTIGNLLL